MKTFFYLSEITFYLNQNLPCHFIRNWGCYGSFKTNNIVHFQILFWKCLCAENNYLFERKVEKSKIWRIMDLRLQFNAISLAWSNNLCIFQIFIFWITANVAQSGNEQNLWELMAYQLKNFLQLVSYSWTFI